MLNFENLDKALYDSDTKYQVPILPSLVLCYGTIPERFNEKVIKMGEYKHQKYIS